MPPGSFTMNEKVHTIDLNFMGIPGAIAAYLIPHENGAILVECGPGSTVKALQDGMQTHGFRVTDLTDVFLTHIHLDHAGAAGWLALQGARIHVHPAGAPHLLDPQKLLKSAKRIYGDRMDELWGDFLPVPEGKLSIHQDEDVLNIDGLEICLLDTPGHAKHHYAYIINKTCFTGDVGGVRLNGPAHIRLPMPPPEFHLETWRESLARLQAELASGAFSRIAATHFGIYEDPDWHLAAAQQTLNEVEEWILKVMPGDPAIEQLREQYINWAREQTLKAGVSSKTIESYERANPSWMSAYGIQRYWRKHRGQESSQS